MNISSRKIIIPMAVIFQTVLILKAVYSIFSNQWVNFGLSILAMFCILIPFIITKIAKKKKIMLLSSFEFMLIIFIFFTIFLGEIYKFYEKFLWWDMVFHAISGGYLVMLGISSVNGVITKERDVTEQRFIFFVVLFAFSFTLAIGTLWEIFEYVGDIIIKSNMVKGGLKDTETDLIVKTIGAFITSIVCYFRKVAE